MVAQKRGLYWVDLIAPTEAELNRLQQTFEFHPLSIEDSSHFHQRSKVDAYDGYLFITLYAHRFDKEKQEILGEAESSEANLGQFIGGPPRDAETALFGRMLSRDVERARCCQARAHAPTGFRER